MNTDHPLETSEETIADATPRAIWNSEETACCKSRQMLSQARTCVKNNPVPVILGALVFGAAVGYMIVSRRHVPSFRERLYGESVRETLARALAPASHGAHKIIDAAHHFSPERAFDSASEGVRRAAGNLKFW